MAVSSGADLADVAAGVLQGVLGVVLIVWPRRTRGSVTFGLFFALNGLAVAVRNVLTRDDPLWPALDALWGWINWLAFLPLAALAFATARPHAASRSVGPALFALGRAGFGIMAAIAFGMAAVGSTLVYATTVFLLVLFPLIDRDISGAERTSSRVLAAVLVVNVADHAGAGLAGFATSSVAKIASDGVESAALLVVAALWFDVSRRPGGDRVALGLAVFTVALLASGALARASVATLADLQGSGFYGAMRLLACAILAVGILGHDALLRPKRASAMPDPAASVQ